MFCKQFYKNVFTLINDLFELFIFISLANFIGSRNTPAKMGIDFKMSPRANICLSFILGTDLTLITDI